MSISGSFIVPHPPLIIPAVGKGQESGIQSTINAYHECARLIARLKPQLIILTTPHSMIYQDYFHISPGSLAQGDFGSYRASNVKVTAAYDQEFVTVLEQNAASRNIPAGTLGERDASLDHGTMIPLYFINQYYQDYQVVRIGLSGLSADEHYRFGMCIADTVKQLDRKAVFVASGDLSHRLLAEGPYGFTPEGVQFDQQITQAMAQGDFGRFLTFSPDFLEQAAECGLHSFLIMAGALDKTDVDSQLLSYEGPFGVGYGVASFIPVGINDERAFLDQYLTAESRRLQKQRNQESTYVKLARYTLEYYINHNCLPDIPTDLPENFYKEKAGVFVSLKKRGQLRGCIGTILPVTENITEEIRRNAVSAGIDDPRFDPVQPEELQDLEYSVDILTEPEPIDSAAQLDPKRYGVIVTHGAKRGLLLPDLAGVDTTEEQIAIARQKAGIRSGETISLSRFEVVRYR